MNNEARNWLIRRAIQSAPYEACGFVLENDELIEIRNVATNPLRGFKMDRRDAIEKLSNRVEFITGIWHTHPKGTSEPSLIDLDGIKSGAVQKNWDYFIATSEAVYQYDTKLYAQQDLAFWEKFHVGAKQ